MTGGESGIHDIDPVDRIVNAPDSIETLIIKASFIGTTLNPALSGQGLMEYKCNYFIGNDPAKWCTDVPNYESIVYKNVYAGIDLKYYGNGKQMEYDFIVSPGADPSQIAINYEGAISISVNSEGELVVETDWGKVIEHEPLVYQEIDGRSVPIECTYTMIGDNRFGFELDGVYDDEFALVIDPVLSYSTFLGGNGGDWSNGIAVDASGAAYVAGHTESTNFPTTPGSFQTNQGDRDVVVSKFSPSGMTLVYSTYLGGGDYEEGKDIAVDGSGCAYITGTTLSDDFPMQDPYNNIKSNWYDAFVTKIGPNGDALVYSTYLGGNGSDNAYGRGGSIVVDKYNCAYVAGETNSSDLPITEGAYDSIMDNRDAFVTKFSATGNTLIYSTYLGGSDYDYANAIAIDSEGFAYVTGVTNSIDFSLLNAFDSSYNGNIDVFVSKLGQDGGALIYSTYLGGTDEENGYGIAVDLENCAYITGRTLSSDFPTQNPIYGDQDSWDAFITKFNASGDALTYSTYIGGNNVDFGWDAAVDANYRVYITGETHSNDFPTKVAYQPNLGGPPDAFVTRLNSNGDSLTYSTYLGGNLADYGLQLALGDDNSIFVTGYSFSTDFPAWNAWDSDLEIGPDMFVTKIPSIITVSNDYSAGYGSLLAAIDSANANPGFDVIAFAFGGLFN